MTRLERSYDAPPETIWELWTTAAGIEQWWAPDGFTTEVRELDLRPGGTLVHAMTASAPTEAGEPALRPGAPLGHAMTASAPEMVEFTKSAGLPLTSVATKTFTE